MPRADCCSSAQHSAIIRCSNLKGSNNSQEAYRVQQVLEVDDEFGQCESALEEHEFAGGGGARVGRDAGGGGGGPGGAVARAGALGAEKATRLEHRSHRRRLLRPAPVHVVRVVPVRATEQRLVLARELRHRHWPLVRPARTSTRTSCSSFNCSASQDSISTISNEYAFIQDAGALLLSSRRRATQKHPTHEQFACTVN